MPVAAHETLHALGEPDMYHAIHDSLTPLSFWSPMNYILSVPQHSPVYEKWKYTGWVEALPEVTGGRYFLHPIQVLQDVASGINTTYKLDIGSPSGEYFVVEYRNAKGFWEGSLRDSGLLIMRVNPALTGNSAGPPDELYAYRPGGTFWESGDVRDAAFSIEKNKPCFNVTTDPQPFMSDSSIAPLFIADIGPYGDSIDFFFAPTYDVLAGSVTGSWDSQSATKPFAYWLYYNCYTPTASFLAVGSGSYVYLEPTNYLRGDGQIQFYSGPQWTQLFSLGSYRTGLKTKGDVKLTNGGMIKMY